MLQIIAIIFTSMATGVCFANGDTEFALVNLALMLMNVVILVKLQ